MILNQNTKAVLSARNKNIIDEFVAGSRVNDLAKKHELSPSRIREIVGCSVRSGGRPRWRWRLYCSVVGKTQGPSVWFRWFIDEEEARRARASIAANLVLLQRWDDRRKVFAGSEKL